MLRLFYLLQGAVYVHIDRPPPSLWVCQTCGSCKHFHIVSAVLVGNEFPEKSKQGIKTIEIPLLMSSKRDIYRDQSVTRPHCLISNKHNPSKLAYSWICGAVDLLTMLF